MLRGLLSSFFSVLLIAALLGTTLLPPIAERLDEDFVPTTVASSFYDLSATTLEGEKLSFDTLKGKVVLVVNVASYW